MWKCSNTYHTSSYQTRLADLQETVETLCVTREVSYVYHTSSSQTRWGEDLQETVSNVKHFVGLCHITNMLYVTCLKYVFLGFQTSQP